MGREIHTNRITEGVLWKEMLLFFFPIFLQSVFQQAFGIIDAIIVGQGVGKYALGAINSTSNLTKLFLNLFLGFCSGSAILIGQAWGAGKRERAQSFINSSMCFSIVGGIVTAIICVPATPLFLKIMRVPEDMLPYSSAYTKLIFVGFIGVFIYDMAAAILRAYGDSKRPFYYLITAMALNLFFDCLFVLVFHWGVAGAAAATAVSHFVSALLAVRQLCALEKDVRLELRKMRLVPSDIRQMAKLGIPMSISGCLYSISNIAIQSTVNSLGTDVISGWSVHVKVNAVIWSLYDAFGVTASTFAAQNFGAKKIQRVKDGLKTSLLLGMLIICSCSLLIWLFNRPLASLFISDRIVVDTAVQIERIMVFYYFFYLFGEVFTATIRGCGETFRPMLITLIGTCGFRVGWVVCIHLFGGPTLFNVAIGYPASWFFNSLLVTVYFFLGNWRKRLQQPEGVARNES